MTRFPLSASSTYENEVGNMAYRFRRRMRQIGIGYRVRTVITLLSRILLPILKKKKKKERMANIIITKLLWQVKKKVFKEIFQKAMRNISRIRSFFLLSKRWRNTRNGIETNVIVSRLYKWETKCTVIEQSVKTEKGLRDLKKY